MSVVATAAEVLRSGRLPKTSAASGPQPVAFMREGDLGAVLFLLGTRAGEWMAIVALLRRAGDGWDEITLVHKPWWDPADPFDDDELMLTGGHSRFVTGPGPEVVLIAGQAAAGACISGVDGDVVVHPPAGHFIYVAAMARHSQPVTLTARRGGSEQTSVFEPPDIP